MLQAHAGRLTAPGVMTRGRAWLQGRLATLSGLRPAAAAAAAGAPVRPGERVLASVRQVTTALVIATNHALYYHDGADAGHGWSRLAWEDVDHARWDSYHRALTLTRAGGAQSSPVVLHLARSTPLLELAHERVTATTLARAPLLSGGRVCGWLTARRPPGSDPVRWVLSLQDAAAAGDPALQSCVTRAIAVLEADLGVTSWRPPASHQEWWPQS